MKSLKLTLAALGAITLACAGMETEDDGPISAPPTPAADVAPAGLTGMWSTMSLPWSGGELVASDDTMLLVAWGTSEVPFVQTQYDGSLTSDGWTGLELLSDSQMVVSAYTKGTSNIGMMVITEEGQTFAYMEDLSQVEESAVEAAKAGERPTGVSGRRPGRKRGKGKRGRGGKNKNR